MREEHEFRLEEYRHISASILDLDSRIITVFGLSLAAAGTLLGVTVPAIFGEAGPMGRTAPLALVCWSFVPTLLVALALKVQINLRRDMVRLGMYRKVFFEDDGVRGLHWESALEEWRKRVPGETNDPISLGETNDPIPLAYWAIALASVVLSCAAAAKGAGVLGGVIVVGATAGLAVLQRLYAQWLAVIRSDLPAIRKRWEDVKATLSVPRS